MTQTVKTKKASRGDMMKKIRGAEGREAMYESAHGGHDDRHT